MTYRDDYTHAPQGVPNPYRPRLHNWRGGPYNEGSLFHGPNYTEPQFGLPRMSAPLWQYGPPGVAGLGAIDMYRDANTRDGSFAPNGYGGGIFNGNTALGADTLPIPGAIVIWGVPNPSLVPVQVKMSQHLLANGLMPIRVDGVLDESFCKAMIGLVDKSAYDGFTKALTPDELAIAFQAGNICLVNSFIQPSQLPCGFPGSTNTRCGGGVTPPVVPPVIPPVDPLPSKCPSPLVLDLRTGLCVPQNIPPLPSTTCPPGQIPNPLSPGQCIPLPGPLPSTTCPPGQIPNPLSPGQCIPLPGPLPPGPLPPGPQPPGPLPPGPIKTCPSGQIPNPSNPSQCIPLDPKPPVVPPVTPPAKIETKTNYTPYIVGGVVVVGVVAYLMMRKK